MKNFKCDICGNNVGECELNTLYENIQQKEIEHICMDCNKELITANTKIKKALDQVRIGWVQKVINKMLLKKSTTQE